MSMLFLFCAWMLHTSHISAQPAGFLSLDCGATQSYQDEIGIDWVPDYDYITTGSVRTTSSEYAASRKFQTLRSFDSTTQKHCYSLPVTPNMTYLVRPYFFYGNYDGLQTAPSFDVMIDANNLLFIDLRKNGTDFIFYELIVKSSSDTLSVCFGSTSASNAPFVSALDLRLMGPGMYEMASVNQALTLLRRLDIGAILDTRYPDDPYDRWWKAYMPEGIYPVISTNSSLLSGKKWPPSKVMQTATTSNDSMAFSFGTFSGSINFYLAFYFAEFSQLSNGNVRSFDISVNSSGVITLLYGGLNIQQYLNNTYLTPVQCNAKSILLNAPMSFLFTPTTGSTLGPVLNAAELLLLHSDLSIGTNRDDVLAINAVRSYFKLEAWSGDPCFPPQYAWSWVKCDTVQIPAQIVEIKLSNFKLHGSIPDLTQLVHLRKIWLDNNNLQGVIPNLTSLTSLTLLHLENNKLSGAVPDFLYEMKNLQELTMTLLSALDVLMLSGNPCSQKKKRASIVVIATTVSCGFLVVLVGILLALYRWRPTIGLGSINDKKKSTVVFTRTFTYQAIVKATSNFQKLLGEGGFGPVYYGMLDDGQEVAVKVHSGKMQGFLEFNKEIDVLSVVHHRNLVSFMGYCQDQNKLILVYQYVPGGTLRESLCAPVLRLDWKQRLNIALDTAQGLNYLHSSCVPQIIHRDVKSSNILLDKAMVAKVADFGLSVCFEDGITSVATGVKGTPGYVDPEYFINGRLTKKSDVYSFGVVLFELASGRPALLSGEQTNLVNWVSMHIDRGDLESMVDSKLRNYEKQAMWKLLELAMLCTEKDSTDRPSMSTVVSELKEAIRLEEASSSSPLYTDSSYLQGR